MEDKKQTETLEIGQLILGLVKGILTMSLREPKKGSFEVVRGNHTDTVFQEDSRKAYINAVENLALVLTPFFDEEAQAKYDEAIKTIKTYNIVLRKQAEEKLLSLYAEHKDSSDVNIEPDEIEEVVVFEKLEAARELFKEMNKLLMRNDYLKTQVMKEVIS